MTSPRLSKTLRRQIKSARSSTVKESHQTEGIKGRDQGPLPAKTAEHPTDHTDQISLLLDQKTTSAPPPPPPLLERERGGQEEATAGEKPVKESPPEKTQVSSTTSQVTVIAGRTKYFTSAWQEITADKQILEMTQGCPLEFESMPKQLSKAHPISHNPAERKIINTELDKLLS